MKAAAQKKLKSHVLRRGHCRLVVTETLVSYWFHIINKAAFGDSLVRPTFIIRPMRGYWGWCRAHNGECIIEVRDKTNNRHMFISTIAHEMVHLWQWQCGIDMGHGQTYIQWKKFFKDRYGIVL